MYQCSLAVGTYKEELVHNLEVGTVKFREVPLTALIDSTGDICGLQSVRAAEIKIKSHQMESIKLNQFYHLTANISAKLTIFISSFYRLTATECQK